MIDPQNITDYKLTQSQLEENILFWVTTAGKPGNVSAICLNDLLYFLSLFHQLNPHRLGLLNRGKKNDTLNQNKSPFGLLKLTSLKDLIKYMKRSGVGCYNSKAQTFLDLANSCLDLKNCTVDDLESIKGIGPKTARCFLIHTRPNQRLAGLDTHVLKFLKEKGIDNVPKSTPSGKNYKRLEEIFLTFADKSGKTVAEYDLEIWNHYSSLKAYFNYRKHQKKT